MKKRTELKKEARAAIKDSIEAAVLDHLIERRLQRMNKLNANKTIIKELSKLQTMLKEELNEIHRTIQIYKDLQKK